MLLGSCQDFRKNNSLLLSLSRTLQFARVANFSSKVTLTQNESSLCFVVPLINLTSLTPLHPLKPFLVLRARNKLFTSATEAFRRGQGMLARDLARRGRELNLRMKEKHRQAASEIFSARNPGDQVHPWGCLSVAPAELSWDCAMGIVRIIFVT